MSDKDVWAPCIHGVPADKRCWECWPEELDPLPEGWDDDDEDTNE
jgi:hypothetical protein